MNSGWTARGGGGFTGGCLINRYLVKGKGQVKNHSIFKMTDMCDSRYIRIKLYPVC